MKLAELGVFRPSLSLPRASRAVKRFLRRGEVFETMTYQKRQGLMAGYSFIQVGSLEASAINIDLGVALKLDPGNKSKEGALALAKAALAM